MHHKKHVVFSLDKSRYALPNQWDLLALGLLFGLLGWLAWGGSHMVMPYELGQALPPLSLDPYRLPSYAGLSVLRMVVALLVSLLFSVSIGTLAAKNPYAAKLIIPCIDVLQSVPVLGFLSLTVTGFIWIFSGSRLGPECAAIFAIFTAQAWNMALSFYQSLRSIPTELMEATTLFQLSPWQRFWRLEVPFALPGLLWNMMLSMSGSWVFLVASESITVSNYTIHLPGIGSYLGLAINTGSLQAVAWAVLAMLAVILIYDQLFFRPLIAWSRKFSMQETITETESRAWLTILLQRTHILKKLHYLLRHISEWFLQSTVFNISVLKPNASQKKWPLVLSYITKMIVVLGALYTIINCTYYGIKYIEWQEIFHALLLGGITALRVVSVVLVSSIVWVPIGVWIGLRPQLSSIIQPLIQFLAAFPGNVLFPLVTITLLRFHLSFEWGVLPLMLLGSQWYILFNVIAGASSIPRELYHITQNLGVTRWLWWKRLILPAIFPYLVTGIMTAVGAAWNISVIAEVIQWGSLTMRAVGLGAYIELASSNGNTSKVAVGIVAMSIWILLMNYLIWQPLYRLSQSKYRLN